MGNFIIDVNTRTITLPAEFINAGVKSDHNALKVYFEIDRVYDGEDLSTHNIAIQYINANGEKDVYIVSEIDLSTPDKIIFSWEISNHVTKYSGTVSFAAKFYSTVDNVYTYTYNTSPASFEVLDGITVTLSEVTTKLDILNQIPTKTSDLTNDSGFITEETDPTVPAWAKEPTKPIYTATEVGALPSLNVANNQTTTVAGYALDAREANPTITDSLGYKIEQVNSNLGGIKQIGVFDLANPPEASVFIATAGSTNLPSGLGNACMVFQVLPGNTQWNALMAFSFGSNKIAINRITNGGGWGGWEYTASNSDLEQVNSNLDKALLYKGSFAGDFNDTAIPHGYYNVGDASTVQNSPSSVDASWSVFIQYGGAWRTQKIITPHTTLVREYIGNPSVWQDWIVYATNSDLTDITNSLNNNTISTSGLTFAEGTIEDGGYTQDRKTVIVNIRLTGTSLASGEHHVTGFPPAKNNNGKDIVSVNSFNSQVGYASITSGGTLTFGIGTAINTNYTLIFSATYVTT